MNTIEFWWGFFCENWGRFTCWAVVAALILTSRAPDIEGEGLSSNE